MMGPERISVWIDDHWLRRTYYTADEMKGEPWTFKGGVEYIRADLAIPKDAIPWDDIAVVLDGYVESDDNDARDAGRLLRIILALKGEGE